MAEKYRLLLRLLVGGVRPTPGTVLLEFYFPLH